MTTVWMTPEQYEKHLQTLSTKEVIAESKNSNICLTEEKIGEWMSDCHPEILDDNQPDFVDDNFDEYYQWLIEL